MANSSTPSQPAESPAPKGPSIGTQIQRNAVALISLTIAVCSLSYNTWRNETTERQRNLRHASFEVIDHLEQLQSVVNAMVYPSQRRVELWVDGWGQIKAAQTLSTLLPEPVPQTLDALVDRWTENVSLLRGDDREAAQRADLELTKYIDQSRSAVLTVIKQLE